jgi:hypothetical protein
MLYRGLPQHALNLFAYVLGAYVAYETGRQTDFPLRLSTVPPDAVLSDAGSLLCDDPLGRLQLGRNSPLSRACNTPRPVRFSLAIIAGPQPPQAIRVISRR